MLQLLNIKKKFTTGTLTQTALDDVSVSLRGNEFVAVLGPSGSGKTTLLNVIGGLDCYDSGDLIINGRSTKKYKNRDWDTYRNHTIGFVFQSYNLIPHQSVLANVELALTISGISRKERRARAKKALEQVGLGDQLHKKPNQMSGGQMQRVAIARALVNNPDIVLADEPTGALDSETSAQVMDLLKEVAQNRLVVMVTHNPELAERYATRIIRLYDGKITDDTNPFSETMETAAPLQPQRRAKSSMSFFTALSLSFNNLRTKKGRTLLTSFAGSIGIIGIALILSLSNGVNTYITDIQKSTMTSYPITIAANTYDLTEMISAGSQNQSNTEKTVDHDLDAVYSDGSSIERASGMASSFTHNNLTDFKKYLDDPDSEINRYLGENGIVYSYQTKFSVYTHDPDGVLVNTDGSTLAQSKNKMVNQMSSMNNTGNMPMMSGTTQTTDNKNFQQLLPGQNGSLISNAVTDSYEVLYGDWPAAYNEVIIVLDKNNEISATALYDLGILPSSEYRKWIQQMDNGEKITMDTRNFSYSDICSQPLYLIPACDTYSKNTNGTFDSIAEDTSEIENLLKSAVELKITGIVRPCADADYNGITSAVCYTEALTDYLIKIADASAVVTAQKESNTINILNGVSFSPADDQQKASDAKTYLSNLGISEKATFAKDIMTNAYADNSQALAQLSQMDESQLASMLDSFLSNPDEKTLISIYDTSISPGSYDDNMTAFGAVSTDVPSSISIYTDSFENKDHVSDCITHYNLSVSDENKITYTDFVGLLMSSVTTIINVISYVLIAFVAVSLVVSSIMIGIITYISVLERTKEIGILRAIGASKHNISQVFNAETLIIGLCAGLIGVGITLLLLIPGNALIHHLTDSANINAALPVVSAVILILLSMLLTFIGGLIPSKKAAKKDPVAALRTE